MSLRDQVTALRKRGAARRRIIHGAPFTFSGKPYCGSFSAITSSRELESGGWKQDVSTIVRVDRAAYPAFTPVDGGIVTLTETGVRFRITQIKDKIRGPEWVFGCVSPEA